jgi:hypothetical protein
MPPAAMTGVEIASRVLGQRNDDRFVSRAGMSNTQ